MSLMGDIATAIKNKLLLKVDKVTSTDNAVVRFNGTTGAVQNSGVTIDDSNNVGIGVTPSAWGSPFSIALETKGGAITSNGVNTLDFWQNSYYNGSQAIYKNTGVVTGRYAISNGHNWYIAPSGTAGNAINWTNAMTLDSNGNLLLQSGTGGLGYGTGAGGTVTQLTSKSTAVTLNKPTGMITMNSSALAAGASVSFTLNNTILGSDTLIYAGYYNTVNPSNYRIETVHSAYGYVVIKVTNISGVSLSESLQFIFTIIKGYTA